MYELSIHCTHDNEVSAAVTLELRERGIPMVVVAEGAFTFHLSHDERQSIQWYLEEYPFCPWGAYQDRASAAEAMIRKVGKRLFRATFSTEQQKAIYASVVADIENTSIAIVERTRTASAIPWEFLQDPAREGAALSRQARSFYRTEASQTRSATPLIDGPLNVLMVIARPRGPNHDVPFQSVARSLVQLFDREEMRMRVRLTVLDPPTFSNLSSVLGERPGHYHIVHFDGHGGYPTIPEDISGVMRHLMERGLQGCLLFEGESTSAKKDRQITGGRFGAVIARGKVPVVLLNACQSGMADRASLFPSIGHQVLKAGAVGVVAMTYSVLARSAAAFMCRLYETLLGGGDLGYAVRQGREELARDTSRTLAAANVRLQDWVVPVLLQSGPVALVRPADRSVSVAAPEIRAGRRRIEIDCPPPPRFGLIGRDGPLLELERAFRHESVAWIKGTAGVGKTEVAVGFARWLASSGRLDGVIIRIPIDFEMDFGLVAERIAHTLGRFHANYLDLTNKSYHCEKEFESVIRNLREDAHFIILDDTGAVFVDPFQDTVPARPAHTHDIKAFALGLLGGNTRVLVVSTQSVPDWLVERIEVIRLSGLSTPDAIQLAEKSLIANGLRGQSAEMAEVYQKTFQLLNGNPRSIIEVGDLATQFAPAALRSLFDGWEGPSLPTSLVAPRHPALFGPADELRRSVKFATLLEEAMPFIALFRGIASAEVLSLIGRLPAASATIRDIPPTFWNNLLGFLGQFGWFSELVPGFHEVHPGLVSVAFGQFPSVAARQTAAKTAFVEAMASLGEVLEQVFHQDGKQATRVLRLLEDNFLVALGHAIAGDDWGNTLGLLTGISRLYRGQARWSEWAGTLSAVRAAIGGSADRNAPFRVELLSVLSVYSAELIRHGLYPEDAQNDGAPQYLDLAHEARIRFAEGVVALEQRRLDDAERAFLRSFEIAESDGEPLAAAQPAQNLGNIGIIRGRLEEARFWFEKSLALVKDVPAARLQPLYQMGLVCVQECDFLQAEAFFTECRTLASGFDNYHLQASIDLQLGVIALQNELEHTAERFFRSGLALAERTNDLRIQAGAKMQLAFVVMRLGRFDEAEQWALQVSAHAEKLKDTDIAGMARELLVELVQAKMNPWYQAGLKGDSDG